MIATVLLMALGCGGAAPIATGAHRTSVLRFPIAPLEYALIVGHATPREARVWVRAPGGAELHVEGVAHAVVTNPSADHTAVVTLSDVADDTPLVLTARGTEVARGRVRALHASERLCFAFVSCHLPFAQQGDDVTIEDTVDMLDTLCAVVEQRDVAFVLHLGDQIYADADTRPAIDAWRAAREGGDPLSLYRDLYRGFWAIPALRRLHGMVPNLMMWDDGDTCDVFGSKTLDEPIAPAMVAAARAAFLEYQRMHGPARVDDETFAYTFSAGPASFFVLDLRARRDHAARRLMGDAQWAAFERWLRETDHLPIRFVASSVPLLHTPDALVEIITRRPFAAAVPDAFLDRWSADPFHDELVRMCALLAGRRVVVLAGDIHVGAAMDILEPKVPQWISSAITNRASLRTRLECEGLSRVANLAGTFAIDAHFHEVRNNFGIVEVENGRARFELWARSDSGGAKKMYEVETPW